MEEGMLYHIYNCGNNKQPIFFEERNYSNFLKLFDRYLSLYVGVYAYCLMTNHSHFLIKINEIANNKIETVFFKNFDSSSSKKLTPIEKAFRDFSIAYSKSINNAYNRTGALFQRKFKKKEIEDDAYLTSVIQYIHANPITAGLCLNYEDWKYSSYKAIIGDKPTKVMKEEVLEWFGNKKLFIQVHRERKLELEKLTQYLFD